MASTLSYITLGLLAVQRAFCHPGHPVAEEAAERAEFIKRAPKGVRSCAPTLQERGHYQTSLARRQELAKKVRAKRGLTNNTPILSRRDFSDYNSSHASTKDVAYGDDEMNLFTDNSSCVLQPEVTQGPYYVDGELIRTNMVEDQQGVPLYLDVQLLDTSTCEPVPATFVDFWHCNSTGVYSGVSASGNGNSDSDTSNLDATFLRAIQPTDVNGVVQIETIFPGHYTGRATHIHLLTHNQNSTTVRTNSTLLGSNFTTQASHVGQLFFDQSLISAVEKTAPYSTNTQDLTLNADDMILGEEAEDSDPFVEYVLLGDDVSGGVLAWISIGIDPTSDQEISSAATSYESGGVANPDGGMGGDMPGGGSPPNGTMPSGGAPSGSMAPLEETSAA